MPTKGSQSSSSPISSSISVSRADSEDDTGREIWVEVQEQPDEFEGEPDIDVAEIEHEQQRSTTELIEAGESNTVEYKQTARYNPRTRKVDKQLEHSVLKTVAGFRDAGGVSY